MAGTLRCLLVIILTLLISTVSGVIESSSVKGVSRLNNSLYCDYYFTCHTMGETLQWTVGSNSLSKYFENSTTGSVIVGSVSNCNYTATLLSLQPLTFSRSFKSALILSCLSNFNVPIICSDGFLSRMINIPEKESNLRVENYSNSVYLEHVLSQNLVNADKSTCTNVFVCGVNGQLMRIQLGDATFGFTNFDSIGTKRQAPQGASVEQQAILIDKEPYNLVVAMFLVDSEIMNVTCGTPPNIIFLSSMECSVMPETTSTTESESSTAESESSTAESESITDNSSSTANSFGSYSYIIIGVIAAVVVIVLYLGCLGICYLLYDNRKLKKEEKKRHPVNDQEKPPEYNMKSYDETLCKVEVSDSSKVESKVEVTKFGEQESKAESGEAEIEAAIPELGVPEVKAQVPISENAELGAVVLESGESKLKAEVPESGKEQLSEGTVVKVPEPSIIESNSTKELNDDKPCEQEPGRAELRVKAPESESLEISPAKALNDGSQKQSEETAGKTQKPAINNPQPVESTLTKKKMVTTRSKDKDSNVTGPCYVQPQIKKREDYESFCNRVLYVISVVDPHVLKLATKYISAPDESDGESDDGIIELEDSDVSLESNVYIGMIGAHPVGLIKHGIGDNGSDILEKSIRRNFRHAKFLIAAGICIGFNHDMKVADFIISKEIATLSFDEKTNNINENIVSMTPKILSIFCHGADDFHVKRGEHEVGIFVGKIASGSELFNNGYVTRFALKEKTIYGGDRVGEKIVHLQKKGIKRDSERVQDINVIVIKSVTRYADEQNSSNFEGVEPSLLYITRNIRAQRVKTTEKTPKEVRQRNYDIAKAVLLTRRMQPEHAERMKNHKKVFDDIMKSEKQVVKMIFAKLIFLGPPERGKTLTRLRLEEVIENMESDPEYKNNPSTQVAKGETYLLTDLCQTVVVASESEWRSLKEESEDVKLVYELFYKLKQETRSSFDAELSTKMHHALQNIKTFFSRKSSKNPFDTVMKHVPEMFEKSVASSHSFEELTSRLENLCLLYMKDTGGRPELMDLLPALIIGPALYLLFCKLGEDLDKTYKICLRGIPNTIPDRMSSCTVRENFMSALSCIFSMHSYSARNTPEGKGILFDRVIQDAPNAVAYIVGTHKDNVSADEIIQFDEKMQKVIKDTVFYEKDLVHFVSRDGFESCDPKDIMPDGQDRLIYPIDNHFGTKEEIKSFQKFILKALKNFPSTEIPARWLPFSLFLRSIEGKYVELGSCYQYGELLGMDMSETDVALWFFHHRTGVIMHFPSVPELKDFVITDTQFIFDSFSNFIFENGGNSMSKAAENTFLKVGQLSFDDIKKISGEVFPPKQMEALLKHLNVIAPLNRPLAGKMSHQQQLYFMPCILENCSDEELKEFVKSTKSQTVTTHSIRLCYECGFVPIGVFPALIAKLAGQPSSTGKHAFKLSDKDEMKKNLIKFTYGKDRDEVIFISTSIYFEIIIVRPATHQTSDSRVCTEVREKIEFTLTSMSDNSGSLLHNVESVCGGYQWAFDCPDHPGDSHMCVVEMGDDNLIKMECHMSGKWINMKEKHQVWFIQNFEFDPQRKLCKSKDITASSSIHEDIKSDTSKPKHQNQYLLEDYHQVCKKISENNRAKLQEEIQSDHHIFRIAKGMIDWENKYDLFCLCRHEVYDIKNGQNKDIPILQRIDVLHAWKDKFLHPTYECLLEILVEGGFTDCVTEIVAIINED